VGKIALAAWPESIQDDLDRLLSGQENTLDLIPAGLMARYSFPSPMGYLFDYNL
jgi:hypothetical protein